MLLNFFNTVANLKEIPRQGWIDKLGITNPESVSDHSYSMTVIAMVISEIQKLDTLKVLKMCLLHDIPESQTGDITPDRITNHQKKKLEEESFRKILKEIPEEIAEDFSKLWEEYQNNLSPEANLVHEVDKLEMALQAKIYEKKGFSNIEPFLKSAQNQIESDPVKELFTKILEQ